MQMHQRRLFRHCIQTIEKGGGEEEEEEVSAYRVRSFIHFVRIYICTHKTELRLKMVE